MTTLEEEHYNLTLYINSLVSLLNSVKNQSIFNDDIEICEKIQTWTFSIIASCAVGLSGIMPLILIPLECGISFKKERGGKTLRLLLSFAVGGLLGDVFLHLLPEAWEHLEKDDSSSHTQYIIMSLWVLIGIFIFVIIEMAFLANETAPEAPLQKDLKPMSENQDSNGIYTNGSSLSNSNQKISSSTPLDTTLEPIQITGYLNLMANGIDNFTHGLAVAASFLVGTKMGLLTTFAILIHEIPHEVGDFAILLKSGFTRWQAARAQMSTASVGVLGTVVALCADSSQALREYTSWILPFTSGGFLNIALVSILPDILKEEDPWESLKQVACICGGIGVMAAVSMVV